MRCAYIKSKQYFGTEHFEDILIVKEVIYFKIVII